MQHRAGSAQRGDTAQIDGLVGPHTQLDGLLYYDPTRPARYPDYGRTPSDDAPDAFLTVITNGKVTGDGIGPHDDLLAEFPYLGRFTTARAKLARGRLLVISMESGWCPLWG